MPIFKEVWQFVSPGIQGGSWSEVYYTSSPNFSQAASFQNSLIAARLQLLHPLNLLKQIRISDILNPRATTILTFNLNGTGQGLVGTNPEDLAVAAVILLTSQAVPGRRFIWMRGIPDGQLARDANGNLSVNPLFRASVNNWIGNLVAGNYSILVRRRATDPITPAVSVSSVASVVTGITNLTLTAAYPGLVAGNTVTVYKAPKKDFAGLSGPFKVITVAGAVVSIPYTLPAAVAAPPAGMYIRLLQYIDGAIVTQAGSGIAYLGTRQTSSPFLHSRGAKKGVRGIRLSP